MRFAFVRMRASRTIFADDTLILGLPVSQPCHAFAEPWGHWRSQEDTNKVQFEHRGKLADTTGRERTRGASRSRTGVMPGSNPGPPNHSF
jgi:hypothetical protein